MPTPDEWRARDLALGIQPVEDSIDMHIKGNTGHCAAGRHYACAHRPGGEQAAGVTLPSTWVLMRHKGRLVVVLDHTEVGPWHTWRCDCACHGGGVPGQQLELDLGVLV